jgi:glycerophosphoryl diester phosphodiesterase
LVFHDWDLDRLTAKQGPVRGRTLEMLSQIPLHGGEAIWTLPELLAEIGGRVPLLVEIKSRSEIPSDQLVPGRGEGARRLHRAGCGDELRSRCGRWFAANAPKVVRGLVVTEDGQSGAFAASRAILAQTLRSGLNSSPSTCVTCRVRSPRALRAKGLPVLTWTVHDEATLTAAREFADAPIAEGEGLELALRHA